MSLASRQFWSEFLQMYQALPALWKVRSEAYKSRALKEEAYKVLIRKVREVHSKADRAYVVRKINTFRTNYRRERNKLQRRSSKGPVRSNLWYFDSLKFLNSHEPENPVSTKMVQCTPDEEQELEFLNESMDAALAEEHEDSLDVTTSFKHQLSSPTAEYEQSPKHQLTSPTPQSEHSPSLDNQLHTIFAEPSGQNFERNDEHLILAQAWAFQYRTLDKRQKFLSQKLISDVLFHGYLGQLKSSHILDFQRMFYEKNYDNDPLLHRQNGIV